MSVYKKYNTKQRTALLAFFNAHADESFSPRQIADALKDENISASSVYRNLSELDAEGKLHKSSKSGSREAFYQYMSADCCKGHLHLSCTLCGKTFHLNSKIADSLTARINSAEGFALDKNSTVLYGICGKCREH